MKFILYIYLILSILLLYIKSNIHNIHSRYLPPKTDKLCRKKEKELGSPKQLNNHAIAQEIDRPFLELDTSNISFNSDQETSFSSPNKSLHEISTNSPPRSPVFSRTYQKTGGTSTRKLQFKAATSVHNNSSSESDMQSNHSTKETTFAKCDPKLKISYSTLHHVETTFLPNGKKLKQSRLVFHPANENKVFLPNTNKSSSILSKTEESSTSNDSAEKAFVTLKSNAASLNETVEDVIEISPTQRVTSRVRNLKLKRKAPIKQVTKRSPKKSNTGSSEMTIDFAVCALPKYTSTQVEDNKDDRKITNPTINVLKNKVNTSDFASEKMHNELRVPIVKSIKTERKSQSEINNVKIIQNTNNFTFEDETFYLPAEQTANRNNMDDINLCDVENKPPVMEILLNKDM